MRKSLALQYLFVSLLLIGFATMITGCGRAREAVQVARSVAELAETGTQMAKDAADPDSSSVDWENYDVSEADVRRFYEGVRALKEKHPDIEFEAAMVATMEAVGAGLNIEELVEAETDMTFEEYGGLSTALLMVQSEAAGVEMGRQMVAAMEEGLAQYEDVDESQLSEEQKAALEQQREALSEAKAELESPDFQAQAGKVEMVNRVREEMGF